MSTKTMRIIALLLIFPLLLAACGGISEDDAEEAIEAYFQGDRDTANDHFCDDDQLSEDDADELEQLGVEDVSASCTESDDQMECDVDFTLAGQEISESFTFDIEDGKLCGGDLTEQ
jgi:hypothetical protein